MKGNEKEVEEERKEVEREPNFSPQLRDKIWEWPGDEARKTGGGESLGTRPEKQGEERVWGRDYTSVCKFVILYTDLTPLYDAFRSLYTIFRTRNRK